MAPTRRAAPERPPAIETLRVCSASTGWQLRVDDLSEPAWTVSTKRKAVAAATDLARGLSCRLVIERSNGTVQNTKNFGAMA